MKPALLLLLALLFKLPATAPAPVRVTFSPLTKAAYLNARKLTVVTKPALAFPVKKVRGRLVVPTAVGPKVFQDKGVGTDNDDQVQYEYLGYAAALKYHLVVCHYWEGYECNLVGDNGQKVALPNEPTFSPDLHSLVVYSAGIEVSYMENTIQVFRLYNGRWQPVWQIEPSVEQATWEPQEVRWLSNSTLLLKKRMWTGKNPGSTYTYAKLTIQ
jgi:hypothetical protein